MSGHEAEVHVGSDFLVACELTRAVLARSLSEASQLNTTQYRVLTNLLGTSAAFPMPQSKLSVRMHIKPNVASIALDRLVDVGYVRRKSGSDARTRLVWATKKGVGHVHQVNGRISKNLYADFPSAVPEYKRLLESAVKAGSRITPPVDEEAAEHDFASRATVAVETLSLQLQALLKRSVGCTYSECRVLLRMWEAKRPLRATELADDLLITPVNVSRATQRLVERGWAQRLRSEQDRRAVFVSTTSDGNFEAQVVASTVDEWARGSLWKELDVEDRSTLEKVGSVVMAHVREEREAAESVDLGKLVPAD